MTKEHEIIMLPTKGTTEEENNWTFHGILKGIEEFYPGNGKSNTFFNKLTQTGIEDRNACGHAEHMWQPQHLYVISNEPIKEKEYFFDKEDNCIYRSVDKQNANSINETRELYDIERYYKIIATTNDKISINLGKEKYVAPTNSNYDQIYTRLCPYPKPSQEFIEYFITQYNKGNVLSKVEVEYDEIKTTNGSSKQELEDNLVVSYRLKINNDNTINISIPSTKMYDIEDRKNELLIWKKNLERRSKEEVLKIMEDEIKRLNILIQSE